MNEVNYSHYENAYDTRQRYFNQKLLPMKDKYRINFKVKEDGSFFFKDDEERKQRIRSILGISNLEGVWYYRYDENNDTISWCLR